MAGVSQYFVEFQRVAKTYDGESLAVADMSLQIAKGEFVTFLGPSGSGKTSSLMMLAGFETPTSGDILLAGKSVRNIPPHRRNIGMVFQNYALFPHMTVAENIAFPLSVRGVSREDIRPRVERALDLVRLAGLGHRRPAALSGGQQQRVALARAVVFNPDLVLMDEPLGALDKQLREQLQLEIKRIHTDLGVTVVYVTHDQSEALTLSDRIAIFKGGTIQQTASAVDIYEQPANAFVAQFIGESNRLDGRVISRNGAECSVQCDGGFVVRALAVSPGAAGSATTLSIRPERVQLSPLDCDCENIAAATVAQLIYHGDHVRVALRLSSGQDFIVKLPNVRRGLALAVGTTVKLGWRTADCRAFEAAEPTDALI
jgi:putative spermidine/putrescine transport system ATP-binding protein